jgi:hypothetical protein
MPVRRLHDQLGDGAATIRCFAMRRLIPMEKVESLCAEAPRHGICSFPG